jgi:nucleoside-diphosphate-sugar epimerase
MKRVLLTGASGFIGRHVADALLRAGLEVHAAVLPHEPVSDARLLVHEADLLDPLGAEGLVGRVRADCLLHLAWYAVPGKFWEAPENERWIGASLRLLRAFGETGGRRAVMAGSCAEYAWGDDAPLTEADSTIGPGTLYGACKHATHVAAAAVARQLGVSLAWGRIFFLYGPGEAPGRLVSEVVGGLLRGHQVPTTDGSQRRDFMHVRDVAGAFAALLTSDVTGPVNIASGSAVPVREIVQTIAEEAGRPDGVLLGELPQRPGEPPTIAADVRRLTEEVGFAPKIDLRGGIREMLRLERLALGALAQREGSHA